MGIALNFAGGDKAESATLTIGAGQLPRVRWTQFVGSAKCQFKIVAGGVTSLVDITDKQQELGLAFSGDVVSVVYDGQGNAKSVAAGVLEGVS